MNCETTRRNVAVLAIGAQSALAQLIVMRAGLERFGGNEFFIGIALSVWLIIGAAGGALFGRLADSRDTRPASGPPLISIGIAGISLGVLLSLIVLNDLSLRLSPTGLAISPLAALGWMSVAAAPTALAAGALFAWLVPTFHRDFGQSLGLATLLESVGAAVGGFFAGSLFLDQLGTPGLVATVIITGGIALYGLTPPPHPVAKISFWPALLAVASLSAWLGWAIVPTPPGLPVSERLENRFGRFTAVEHDGQTTIVSGSHTIVDCNDWQTPELLAATVWALAPDAKDVLVIGDVSRNLALMAELPGRHVVHVTQNPGLEGMVERRCNQPQSPKLQTIINDPISEINVRQQKSDIVLVRPGSLDSLGRARLVTDYSFGRIARLLKPNGLMMVSLNTASVYPSQAEIRLLAGLEKTAREHFKVCLMIPPGSWLLVCGDRAPDLNTVPDNLKTFPFGRQFATNTFFTDALEPLAMARTDKRLAAVSSSARTNRAIAPSTQFHALLDWAGRHYPKLASDPWEPSSTVLLLMLAAIPLLILLGGATGTFRRPRTREMTVAAVTGAAGITVELALMWAVETAYGTLYHWLGGMIAAYMAGLGLGAFAAWRLSKGHPDRLVRMSRISMLALAFMLAIAIQICVEIADGWAQTVGISLAMSVIASCAALSGAAFLFAAQRLRLTAKEGSGHLTGVIRGVDAVVSGTAAFVAVLVFLPLAGTTAVLGCWALTCVTLAVFKPTIRP